MAASSALKRKRSGNEDTGDVSLPVAIKRNKVSFDTSINKIHVVQEYNDKALAVVRDETRRAIERHLSGDSIAYDSLKQILNTDPQTEDALSTAQLRKYVLALTVHANLLSRNCTGLVNAILDIQWVGRDEAFVELYLRLLGNLTSAHNGYARPVLKSLIEKFVGLRSSAGRLRDHAIVKRARLMDRIHLAIQHVLKVIPSAKGILKSIITSAFPYPTDPLKDQVSYVSNLLRITQYEPSVQSDILGLIVERVVKIDAQTQIDIEELEDELEESLMEEVMGSLNRDNPDEGNTVAEFTDDESEDDESDPSTIDDPANRRLQELKSAVAKMDAVLDLVFEFYDPFFAKGVSKDAEAAFEQLFAIFIRSILPTHSSRHTQFLVFHFGQALPSLVERYIFDLFNLAFNQNRPAILRESAVAYIASFVSRGAKIPRPVIRETVQYLCRELENQRERFEQGCRGPDLKRYGVYYALVQALLYIFCFRWRILTTTLDEDDDDNVFHGDQEPLWIPGLKETLHRNIYSKLNPLKVCAPSIVGQFARLAHNLHLMYIYPILETNKRLRLTLSTSYPTIMRSNVPDSGASTPRTGDAQYQLDAYFPFDPYNLPRSKRWIEGEYLEWRSLPGLDNDDAEDSSQREEAEMDVADYDEATETEDED